MLALTEHARDLIGIAAFAIAGALLLVAVAASILERVVPALRDRRDRKASLADVEARVAELDALPPPAELPQARQPTKAEIRAQRGRRHPIARKHRNGRWG